MMFCIILSAPYSCENTVGHSKPVNWASTVLSAGQPTVKPHDLPHALLEHRVASGLADDDVRPLHHHDADKECRVAGELHDLALLIRLCRKRGWRNGWRF